MNARGLCNRPFVAWENSPHFTTSPLVSSQNEVWETSRDVAKCRLFSQARPFEEFGHVLGYHLATARSMASRPSVHSHHRSLSTQQFCHKTLMFAYFSGSRKCSAAEHRKGIYHSVLFSLSFSNWKGPFHSQFVYSWNPSEFKQAGRVDGSRESLSLKCHPSPSLNPWEFLLLPPPPPLPWVGGWRDGWHFTQSKASGCLSSTTSFLEIRLASK